MSEPVHCTPQLLCASCLGLRQALTLLPGLEHACGLLCEQCEHGDAPAPSDPTRKWFHSYPGIHPNSRWCPASMIHVEIYRLQEELKAQAHSRSAPDKPTAPVSREDS